MLIRVRLPNEVRANRETCKVWKNVHARAILTICQATPEEKQTAKRYSYSYASENASNKCVSQQKIFTVQRLVLCMVMNYKMRHNKNRPARDSLLWPDHFSVINICGGRKSEKHAWTCVATCKGSHGGRLTECVS